MKSVWLVDDNSISIEGIIKCVDWQKIDCQVTKTFTDPYEVIKAAQNDSADIIISDICMPGLSGFEMIEKISSSIRNTKIIMISAFSEFDYARKALRLRVYDYIEKPIDFTFLEKVIEKAAMESEEERKNNQLIERKKTVLKKGSFQPLFSTSWSAWGKSLGRQMAESIRSQSKKQVREAVYAAFNENNDFQFSHESMAIGVYSVCGEIIESLLDASIEDELIQQKCIELVNHVRINILSATEISEKLISIGEYACDLISANTGKYNNTICPLVEKYVAAHYGNSELSLEEIADYLSFSTRHLCAIYKRERSISISEYIIRFRIEKACSYLREDNLSIREISERVGYSNQFYFSSSFKKLVGKTPSQYRTEAMQKA